MKSVIAILLSLILINVFPGEHVGNGIIAQDDLRTVWTARNTHYQNLLKNGGLDKTETAFITKLMANSAEEPTELQFANFSTNKSKHANKDKFFELKGNTLTFNKAKLAKDKKKNTKDALLLILMAQAKKHKAKIDFNKLKTKIQKVQK